MILLAGYEVICKYVCYLLKKKKLKEAFWHHRILSIFFATLQHFILWLNITLESVDHLLLHCEVACVI